MSNRPPHEPPPSGGSVPAGLQPESSLREGAIYGIFAGILGAAGMAIVSAILVGLFGVLDKEPGNTVGPFIIYLMFGLLFAAIVGVVGGITLGSALAALNRTRSGPLVGLFTPFAVLVPPSLVWAALDDGSNVLGAAAIAFGLAVLYAPFGLLAGKFYARKMGA